MKEAHYKKLFSPIKVNGLRLKNHITMAPLLLRLCFKRKKRGPSIAGCLSRAFDKRPFIHSILERKKRGLEMVHDGPKTTNLPSLPLPV